MSGSKGNRRRDAQTGKDKTNLIPEAIAQYLSVAVESVGDRLLTLEREVAALQEKFKVLNSS
jgi:hypothetical protein